MATCWIVLFIRMKGVIVIFTIILSVWISLAEMPLRAECAGDDEYTEAPDTSMLKCPNAFSPRNADGVNDEWRVSYKEIAEFRCHIFNRHGQQVATLTEPEQGWDGTYKGKKVAAGVYYYVIRAEGTDRKRYELSGDINLF